MHVCVKLSEYWQVVSSRVDVEINGEAVCMLNHWMCYLNWTSGNMNVNTKTEPYYASLLYLCLLFCLVFVFSVWPSFSQGALSQNMHFILFWDVVFCLLFAISYPDYSLH